jgi:hypothetical protein
MSRRATIEAMAEFELHPLDTPAGAESTHDWRGVDLTLIRDRLAMTPAARMACVDAMLEFLALVRPEESGSCGSCGRSGSSEPGNGAR